MESFTLIKSCRDDIHLRASFNALAQKTFGLDFEDWYQNGFWRGRYIPYSFVADGQVVANVSVNLMDFSWNGKNRNFIQLGTVMTDEKYRNQGLIRRLMEEVEKDYGAKVAGMYLFANDSVLDFYPKFGYRKAEEYQYYKEVSGHGKRTAVKVSMEKKSDWAKLEQAILKSDHFSRFKMEQNPELILFYVTKFMRENVYYIEKWDMYVIAEEEEEKLFLYDIFASGQVETDDIIQAFGSSIRRAVLGFSPICTEGFSISERKEEDTTLFIKGAGLAEFSKERLMFPVLSHA